MTRPSDGGGRELPSDGADRDQLSLEAVSAELDRQLIRAYLAGYERATEDALAAMKGPSGGRKWWRLLAALVGVRGGH